MWGPWVQKREGGWGEGLLNWDGGNIYPTAGAQALKKVELDMDQKDHSIELIALVSLMV